MSWAPANSIWATNLRGVICVVVVYTLLTLKSKLNGIDLELLNVLEARGKTKCDQILPTLRELHKTPSFHTPSFEVTIRRFPGGFYKDDFNDHDHNLSCFMLLVTSQQQDRTLDSVALVLSPDTIDEDIDILLRKLAQAPVVCLLNKMDSIHPSEDAFRRFMQAALEKLKSLGVDPGQIQLIPVSGLTGENVVLAPGKQAWPTVDGARLTLVQWLDCTLASKSKQKG